MRRLLKIEDYVTSQMYYRLLVDELKLSNVGYTPYSKLNPYIIVNIRKMNELNIVYMYICGNNGIEENITPIYDNYKEFIKAIKDELYSLGNSRSRIINNV